MTDQLKPFKISDQQKPTVDKRPAPAERGANKKSEEAPSSAGFPHIEALVESAQPDLEGFDARRAQLDEMAKAAGSPKDKAAAKKAAAAYEKARGLIDYLLETKQKMAGGGDPGASGG